MIPVFRPSVTAEEIEAVVETLKSGWWGLGPRTAEFETAFAAYTGATHAVALNSCTAALHLALHLLDLKPGDEVLVPTVTFVSTAHAALYVGAKPVFVDVLSDTCCIDPEDAARKITSKTRAIVPVHYGGHPVNLEAIHALAAQHNLTVIEDAAHAAGASWRGRKIGSTSPMTCFSFQAVKNLATGDGGAITTNSDEWEQRLRELRWLGISKDTWKRTSEEKVYAWQYWIDELGFKAHMNDLQAALGLVQLRRLDGMNAKRRRLREKYDEALAEHEWIERPIEQEGCESSWHLYAVKVPRRDDLLSYLKSKDIAPGVHYFPIHLHPMYRSEASPCRVAERLWPRLLSLPMFPDMTDDQLGQVVQAVREFDRVAHERPHMLRGERTQLRRINFTDLETMREWRNRPHVRQWFFDSSEIAKERQEAWFDAYLKDDTDETFIIETHAGELVGMISLYHIDRDHDQAEVGRVIIADEEVSGRGYGSDALRTLSRYAFEQRGIERLYAQIREDNAGSIRLFERSGYAEEGRLRRAVRAGERRLDVVLMSRVREETESQCRAADAA